MIVNIREMSIKLVRMVILLRVGVVGSLVVVLESVCGWLDCRWALDERFSGVLRQKWLSVGQSHILYVYIHVLFLVYMYCFISIKRASYWKPQHS